MAKVLKRATAAKAPGRKKQGRLARVRLRLLRRHNKKARDVAGLKRYQNIFDIDLVANQGLEPRTKGL